MSLFSALLCEITKAKWAFGLFERDFFFLHQKNTSLENYELHTQKGYSETNRALEEL